MSTSLTMKLKKTITIKSGDVKLALTINRNQL